AFWDSEESAVAMIAAEGEALFQSLPLEGMLPPLRMPVENLWDHARALAASGKHVSVLWQEPGSLAFVARGREYRSEFHIDPSDELMYMIRGEMRLHYRTPDGQEQVTVLPEGSVIFTPAGTPHSPRFASDAFVFVTE